LRSPFDVTLWYHCGDSDTYGDGNCGGQPMTEPKQTGCRPQVFTVNGTVMPGAYHFVLPRLVGDHVRGNG
jgi:hypothetical protein